MTDKPPEVRHRLVVAELILPRRSEPPDPHLEAPKTPLFFYDRRGGTILNWHHWAAPLITLINILTLPLVILLVVGDYVCRYGSWAIAALRRGRNGD